MALNKRFSWSTVVSFFFFVCIDAFVLPGQLILKNDDFGYLDSVVRSLKEAHLVTSDFLEPFAITLTLLSSLLYRLSHNLWFATYGLLFTTHVLLWWVVLLLARRYWTEKYSGFLATGLLFCPLVFGKLHEFTSVPLYWLFFCVFVLCWPRRSWLACASLILAFGCRQSAMTLLVLPLFSIITKNSTRTSLSILAVALASCMAITVNMDPSFAQQHTTHRLFKNFEWLAFFRCLLAFSLFALAGAGAANALQLINHGLWRKRWKVGLFLLLYFIILQPWNPWLGLDMTYLGAVPHAQLLMFLGLASLAFFVPTHRTALRPQFILLALAMIFLPSLRGAVWDYYGVEIALIGALSVRFKASEWKWNPIILKAGAVIYFIPCLVYAVSLSRFHDLMYLRIKLYEEAERSHRITLHEMSRASFGYAGWKVFDSMVKWREEDGQFHGLAAFFCEINEQASLIEEDLSNLPVVKECDGLQENAYRVIAAVQGKVLGRNKTLSLLVSCSYQIPSKSLSQCLATGQALETKKFPLSNAEWSLFLNGKH